MAISPHTAHLGEVLRALALSVPQPGGKTVEPRFASAIGVIADLSRFANAAPPREEVRTIQAKVAAVRGKLRRDQATGNSSKQMLDDPKTSEVFLSGALWAADEFLEGRLRACEQLTEQAATSQRGMLRALIERRIRSSGAATPKDCLIEAKHEGLDVRPDQVSRALGDLLRDGAIVQTDPPSDGDRRNRYFTLTRTPSAPDSTVMPST